MIRERHVIRMKIPFPSIGSELASSPHMYICIKSASPEYRFVKCQTLKPYMLIKATMKNYCDEKPDIARNPFSKTTRIDCDKVFCTSGDEYDEKLLTTSRPDICEDLFSETQRRLTDYEDVYLKEGELLSLNVFISIRK